VYHAVHHHTLPKRVEPQLVLLRDPKVLELGTAEMDQLAERIKDHNYRVFAAGGQIHLVTAGRRFSGTDPFLLFDEVAAAAARPLDPGHACYLGYEMAKAVTALTLGKDYRQDEALDWGFLTRAEGRHHLKNTPLAKNESAEGEQ
jgi:hypothetical protein